MTTRLFTVLGGTGFLGSRVVRQLLAEGHRVRVAAREPERMPDLLRSDRARPARSDLFEPATLDAALSGADGVLNAVSLYQEKGDLTFEAVHVDGAQRLARAARRIGVPRLIQISGIGSDPDARDPYIRARGRGERVVRETFPGAVIVRPSAMFGPDDALLTAILTTARRLPAFPLFGKGDTRLQPVHVEDVAAGVACLLDADQPPPLHELAGPEILSYLELVQRVSAAAGFTTRPAPLPFPVWRVLARMAEHLPGAPLTRSQVALMQRDNVAAADLPGLPDLGITPRSIVAFAADDDRSHDR